MYFKDKMLNRCFCDVEMQKSEIRLKYENVHPC